MDNLIDPFLSSASWSELHTSPRSSWGGNVSSQTNGLLANSVDEYESDKNNSPICMIPASHIVGNVASEDLQLDAHSDGSSIFSDETLKFLSQPELPSLPSQTTLHENESHGGYSTKAMFGSNLRMAQITSNGNDHSTYPLSSVQTVWAPSYAGGSSFMDQNKLQSFGFQGLGSNSDGLEKSFLDNGTYQHLHTSPTASLHDQNELQTSHLPSLTCGQQIELTSAALSCQQEHNGLPNLQLPSFSTVPQMTMSKPTILQASQQSNGGNAFNRNVGHSSGAQYQAATTNTGGCNGAAKPRVRARRGQATDPHSIAERLRREKIADRMKNLQELIPNSNKTDKASMLDEIIEYVKFLQLQVKVLSMSRLGATGAVVPLITEVQSKDSGSLHKSLMGQEAADISETEDNIALEQEVVKMMETNITAAMQYLQNKNLCLMPIALASAISSQKGSSAAISPDWRKPDVSSHGGAGECSDDIKPNVLKSI